MANVNHHQQQPAIKQENMQSYDSDHEHEGNPAVDLSTQNWENWDLVAFGKLNEKLFCGAELNDLQNESLNWLQKVKCSNYQSTEVLNRQDF